MSSNKTPLVSIIVPIYNQSKYLSNCLESILSQTYKNLEIILINDGSTDNSEKICKKYCKKDSRFTVYKKPNGGLSDARNFGIKKARGEYLSFIDGDDIVHPNFISALIKALPENKDTLISCCRYQRFSNQNKINFAKNDSNRATFVDSRKYLINTLYQKDQTLYTVSACTKLYHKNIFKNLKFTIGILYEDFAIIDKILEQTSSIAIVDQKLYYYRITADSITTSTFNEKKLALLEHCSNLKKRHLNDPEILKSLDVMEFTRSYELLMSAPKTNQIQTALWHHIKTTRFSTLFSDARFKIKLSAMFSYLGKNISLFLITIPRRQHD